MEVLMVFASLGLHPWDANAMKTSIHPYNQYEKSYSSINLFIMSKSAFKKLYALIGVAFRGQVFGIDRLISDLSYM